MTAELRDFKEKERTKYEDAHGGSMIDWIRKHPELISKIAASVAESYEQVGDVAVAVSY